MMRRADGDTALRQSLWKYGRKFGKLYCCLAGWTKAGGGHLDAFSCMDVFQNLYAQGTIDEKTEIVLTHINHYTSTHQQLCEWFAQQKVPYKMTVAYDGYEIK